MKIRMLVNVNGTADGVKMGPYLANMEYEVKNDRAELFIGSAMAVEVLPPKPVVKAK